MAASTLLAPGVRMKRGVIQPMALVPPPTSPGPRARIYDTIVVVLVT